MSLEASDHACPHLRETRRAEMKPITVAPPPRAGCPSGRDRAPAAPVAHVATIGGASGWWAFATQARSLGATA